jgi:hypothetical protein
MPREWPANAPIKAAVGKWKGRRIGRTEIDLFLRPKLGAGDLEHRRIEIGCRQVRASGQCVAQLPRRDPGAGRRFQHPRRIAGGDALRDICGIVDEDERPEKFIIMLRRAANVLPCIATHDNLQFVH